MSVKKRIKPRVITTKCVSTKTGFVHGLLLANLQLPEPNAYFLPLPLILIHPLGQQSLPGPQIRKRIMAFITQRGEGPTGSWVRQSLTFLLEKNGDAHDATTRLKQGPKRELSELEALVSGVDQVSQSTLLLKKMKELREVDDALEFIKEQVSVNASPCHSKEGWPPLNAATPPPHTLTVRCSSTRGGWWHATSGSGPSKASSGRCGNRSVYSYSPNHKAGWSDCEGYAFQ